MIKNFLYDAQQDVVNILKSDDELSSVTILAENNKDIDFPFCLCWANENWSKLWDGGDREVLIKQE